MRERPLFFATKNRDKLKEIEYVLSGYGLSSRPLVTDKIEIQSNSLEAIALFGAEDLYRRLRKPVLVEDAGLFIEVLGGFPGPYSSYVFKTLGTQGILKLMEGVDRREAIFRSALAYCEGEGKGLVFLGESRGLITRDQRGTRWGFDPVFQPLEGDGRTFAEMRIGEKCAISHRGRALRAFAEWYLKPQSLRYAQ